MAKLRIEEVFTAKTGDGASLIVGPSAHHRWIANIVTTVGATPTVDVQVQGSADGITFEDILGTPITITTATTTIIKPNTLLINEREWYPYYRLNLVDNTNVTVTAVLTTSGFPGVDGEI